MAPAQYVIRLDDACPTMPSDPWRQLESAFDELDVRPIVGVIPECRDPAMDYADPDPEFWGQVRRWRDKGWTIALHGLNHVYHPDPPGARALVPFHRRGEFVGLSLDEQRRMIARAWGIFCNEGLEPDFFMAPSHSFDRLTLEAIRAETSIRWITDGISFRPFERYGFQWLPQQIWRLRDAPTGVWTVCLHPNMMSETELRSFIDELRLRHGGVRPVQDFAGACPAHGSADRAFALAYWLARRAVGAVKPGAA